MVELAESDRHEILFCSLALSCSVVLLFMVTRRANYQFR